MNIDQLQRNPEKVQAAMKEVDNQLIAVQDCSIYVPEHYIGSFLGSIEEDVRIVGIFGIVVGDQYYASSRCCSIVSLDPSTINIKEIEGENYMEFSFQKGDTIIKNLNIIRLNSLAFKIFDEIVAKGKVPWYLNYQDICQLFDTTKEYADVNLGIDNAILEMIGSSMARSPDDKTVFYRHLVKSKKDQEEIKPSFVGLRSVAYGATNTTAKLMGAYFKEGLTSALITKSNRTETIEEILRK